MKMSLQRSYFIWEYKITIVQVKMVLANIYTLVSIDIYMQWILNLQKPKKDQVLILPIMIERRNFERKKLIFLVSYVTVRYFLIWKSFYA